MAMATGEEIAQKIHNEQPFSLFETGLKATSKNLKLVKFRVEFRHTLLILRTINFWSKSSRVFKCWEPFYEDDLLSLNAPRWIWSSPRSKKELLQGKTVIMRLLLIASLDDHACCMTTKHVELFHTFSLQWRSGCSSQWERRGKAPIILMPLWSLHLDSYTDTAILCGGSTLNYSLALAWTSAFLLARAIKSLARYQNMSRYWHVALWQLDDRILTRNRIRKGQSSATSECPEAFGFWSFLADGWWFWLLQCTTERRTKHFSIFQLEKCHLSPITCGFRKDTNTSQVLIQCPEVRTSTGRAST